MYRLLTVLSLSCLACSAGADTRSVLRIASDATFAPFHFIGQDGVATGYDIELARAVAEHAGFEVEIRVTDYARLLPGLDDGTHDVVAATTGITTERSNSYLFTTPYFRTCQAIVVRTGANEPRRRVIELTDRRIGAAGSGTSARAMYEILAGEHVRIPDGQGPRQLMERQIDAWIVDEFEAVATARASYGELRVLPEAAAPESYGFVMGSSRDALKHRLDASLEALEESGVVADLRERFGLDRDAEWPVQC